MSAASVGDPLTRVAPAPRSPAHGRWSAVFRTPVGLAAGLLLAAVLLQARPDMQAVRTLPWWAWLGGLYGAVLVAATAYSAPKIGVTSALTLVVAGQFVAAVALDHFGAMGLSERPVSLVRIAGLALIAAGVLLVRRA